VNDVREGQLHAPEHFQIMSYPAQDTWLPVMANVSASILALSIHGWLEFLLKFACFNGTGDETAITATTPAIMVILAIVPVTSLSWPMVEM